MIVIRMMSSKGGYCYLANPKKCTRYTKIATSEPWKFRHLIVFDNICDAEATLKREIQDLRYQAPEVFGADLAYMRDALERTLKAEITIIGG